MADLDDNQLVTQVAQGEEWAFLMLYDRYVGRAHASTLRILSDRMLAEEATQDTFLKLWSRARFYLPERGSLLLWLLTIARRTAHDRLRLEAHRPTLSDSNDPMETLQTIPNGEGLPDENRWRSVHFALQALSPEQRQVM